MKKITNEYKQIKHKKLWLDSMIGMTWGFLATLVVGTIIGLLAINQNEQLPFPAFIKNIEKGLTYITPFGIGVGIGIKSKMKPLQIFAIAIGTFIVGQSLLKPTYSNGINWEASTFGFEAKLFLPGDVFGAWISGVIFIYFFNIIKWETFLDILIVPIVGFAIGFFESFFLTYLTTSILIMMEWTIDHTINKNHIAAIFLAPILGILMGFALSMPTSSAAIALTLKLHGDAATAAMAATAAQMISFGILTYMTTKSASKSIAVAFGSSMLQMNNFMKKPKLLIIPGILSGIMAMLAVIAVPLDFIPGKTTSGMGTSGFYGPIFTLNENGWTNLTAWMHVIFFQLVIPTLISIGLGFLVINKLKWIKPEEMEISHA